MQAEKTSCEDSAVEVGPQLTLHESGDWRPSLVRIFEERLELLADDFMKKRLLRLAALVVGHVDPVWDRVGV